MKLLIYPPFCTPTSPAYSLFSVPSCLNDVEVLDLNLKFHRHFIEDPFTDLSCYDKKAKKFFSDCGRLYRLVNKKIREEGPLPLIEELREEIARKRPESLGFSCLYSQQMFYAHALARGFPGEVLFGGPAAPQNTKTGLPESISYKQVERYYSPETVLPIRGSQGCSYARCNFCNMHNFTQYSERDEGWVREQMKRSDSRLFQFIDDIVPVPRLASFKRTLADLGVRYMCHSRIIPNPDPGQFADAYASGCRVIMWGVESGSDAMLSAMNKGITTRDIEKTLACSADAGIKNVVYILIGFPGETEETLRETIGFLEKNSPNIHLVAANTFSVQPGSDVFANPKKYGLRIITRKRGMLPTVYTYESDGLDHNDYVRLKGKYKDRLMRLNKYPGMFAVYKEHFLVHLSTS